MMLLLIATSTIVVALGGAFAVAAPASGSASSPGPAAARMGNGKRVSLMHFSSLGPTESSPPEQVHPTGLSSQSHLFIVYIPTSSGKRRVGPLSTLRFILRAGVVT